MRRALAWTFKHADVYLSEISHLGLIQGALLSLGRGCLPRM